MKSSRTTASFNLLCLGIAASTLGLVGCQTVKSVFENETPREAVTATASETSAQVAEVNGRIDDAIRHLQDVVNHPSTNLSRQFNAYTDAVDRLENATEELRELNESLQRKGRKYLVEWDREIATVRNADLREQTHERRDEVSQRFETLQERYAAVREQLAPLMRRFDDLESALSVDLTGPGIENVRANLDDLDSMAEPAREGLRELGEALRAAQNALLDRGVPDAERSR